MQALHLLRVLARHPGLCQLLLQPARFSNEQLSAWAALQARADEAAHLLRSAAGPGGSASPGSPSSSRLLSGEEPPRTAALHKLAASLLQTSQLVRVAVAQQQQQPPKKCEPGAAAGAAGAGAQLAGAYDPRQYGGVGPSAPRSPWGAGGSGSASDSPGGGARRHVHARVRPASGGVAAVTLTLSEEGGEQAADGCMLVDGDGSGGFSWVCGCLVWCAGRAVLPPGWPAACLRSTAPCTTPPPLASLPRA